MKKWFFRLKTGWNNFRNSAVGKTIGAFVPSDITEAAAGPGFIIKTLPTGEKIKIVAEGVSGASRRAKRDLKAVDTYIKHTPEATIDKNRVVSNMMKDGIDVSIQDENRIFGEIANGKAALYDKYLK